MRYQRERNKSRIWTGFPLSSLFDIHSHPFLAIGLLILAFFLQYFTIITAAQYLNWSVYEANGVNLGGWLQQEPFIDTKWWETHSIGEPADDEWSLCAELGTACGAILEDRYATWITTADIDKLHSVGVNTLRIPTTYAAWVKVPGSQLYSGNQVRFLRKIATYAIVKYGMHVIIDLHSLPGGTNGKNHGEAGGKYGWFHNYTALHYSLKAVDNVLEYIQESGNSEGYTIAPINEPVDNTDENAFGLPISLSERGASWLLEYIKAVLGKTASINPGIPVMFQGGFVKTSYWSPKLPPDANLVFDVHYYYFNGLNSTGYNITNYIESDARMSGDRRFPVFIGEWSIEAQKNNTLAGRKHAFNAGLNAFNTNTRGSAYWNVKCFGAAAVDGEGVETDYWSYLTFIEEGFINVAGEEDVGF